MGGLLLAWFSGLTILLNMVEDTGNWPQGLLDAYGIDNLEVVRSIGRFLDHGCLSEPLPPVKDGDLIAIIQHLIQASGMDSVSVTKVKGPATEADVEQGRVREEDKLGNAEAGTAADLGWRHQSEVVMDARRCPSQRWRVSVSPSCCVGSWLRLPGFLSIMMIEEGRPLIPWLMLGLMLILQHFLGRLVSCMGPGYRFMVGALLAWTLLPGLVVSVFCARLLLS